MDFRCFLLLLVILKEQLYKKSAAKGTTDPRREFLNHLQRNQIKVSQHSGRNKLGHMRQTSSAASAKSSAKG